MPTLHPTTLCLTTAALVAACTLHATAETLAPERITDAIAHGAKKKNDHHGLVLRDSSQGWLNGMVAATAAINGTTPVGVKSGLWLEVYTPLAWVSQTAAVSTREYRTITLADVDERHLLEPVVRVIAHADTPFYVTGPGAQGTRSVQHVVMQNERRTTTVQPLTTTPIAEDVQNAFGGEIAYTGLELTFALADVEQLRADGEFFIVIVGTSGEKRFKVKRKHFDKLPL